MNGEFVKRAVVFLVLSFVILTGMALPVMAETEVNTFIRENGYTRKPQAYISFIDPTNNQIELMITEMNLGGMLAGVDIGWVIDEGWRDPRVYTLETDYVQRVFSTDGDLREYYVGTNGITRKYRINTEVELSDNPYNQLFVIIRLDTGARMVNEINYNACMEGWEIGKACDFGRYTGATYNNIVYNQIDIEVQAEANNWVYKNELENDTLFENQTTVREDSQIDEMETVVIASVAKNILNTTESNNNTEEDAESEETEDDLMEVAEGAGETTLEVPKLGDVGGCDNENNWFLPFSIGSLFGGILGWFLTFSLGKYFKNHQNL